MRLLDIINTFALTQPEKTALNDCGGTAVTYAQLMDLSGRVYHYLKERGIGREDMVNILLPRGVEPFIAMIGVWRAGAACVILEEGYPAERVKFIRNDCGCRLVMDGAVWQEAMACELLEGRETVDDHDAAFAVYTSGSTGNPKGVLHEYGNVDRIASIDLTLTDYALTSPLNFVASVFGCTSVLHDGGTLFVIPWSVVRDLSAVRECFVRYGITQTLCAPSVFHLFRDIPSLELIIVASEPAYGIWSDDPKLQVYNFYGMSESAFVIAYRKLDEPNELSPIGRACPGVVMTIRDENGQPVPDGEEGELCFRNPYVRGYIGLPEQTARTFVNGETRTGDLAKRLENGDYVVLGRIDDMVKINGNRVEPAEVEAAVQKVTGLKQVMAKGFSENNAAYVCLYYTDDVKIDTASIRETLQQHLPYYMIPSHFIHLDAFPRTGSGKLSRRLLPRPEFDIPDAEYSAPDSAAEKALCDSMAAVLKLDRVSAEADFYALGGSSVTSMELVTRCPLRRLDIGMIYQGRTPRKIARIWQEAMQAADAAAVREADPVKPCPLTRTQMGIYAECARHPGEAIYNNPVLLRFPADTDAGRLQHAVETAVKAHPGLFAQIVLDESGLPAMVYRPGWAEGTLCEITDSTEAAFAARKPALAEPFNIHEDRLFRAEIIRTERAVYLFMDFHHIVFDGTSAHILFDDIARAWRGEEAEPEGYTAWHAAADEASLRESGAYVSAKSWYMEQFGDIEAPSLPEGDHHGEQPVYADKTIPLATPVSALRKFCAEHRLTENAVTTAAFGVLLSGYTREKAPVFTTVYNGRKDSRTGRTVSMFVKTLPLRFNTAGDIPVTELCTAVKEQLLGDMANDIFSFAELAAATGITSDVMFVWQDEMRAVPHLDGVTAVKEAVPFNASGTMLSGELMAEGDRLDLHMEYHADRYSERFIDDFAARYDRVLDQMMRREKLSGISLVSDEEVPVLLQLSRGETLAYDIRETWLDLFRKQVQASPEHKAVTDSEGSYTYAELDQVSDAVAAWLIGQGVTENSFVALRMGRVKEFVAAAVGIHKAGTAYVPIDADYPEDRVNYMLEDSKASLLMTEETVRQAVKECADANPVLRAAPDTLAYMIYTSGSTGRPKGVMIPHRALTNFVHFIANRWGLTENSRIACHSNFAFDASVEDLYPVLTAGGELFIVPEEVRRDVEEMRRYLKENAISGGCYSTQFGQLLAAEEPLDVDYLCLGGEAMTSVPQARGPVYNTYGPTEFTVDATYFELRKGEAYDPIPIGRPLHNCYAFVCDANGHLLPRGMAGELCLAGPQIAEGYRNRPDLTEKVFVDCPWLPGKKMYRTGDLARWNPEDQLEYLGRIDNQVKLRGFRIEMGEIENRAGQYEGIRTVAAQVRRDTLVLYYTADREIDPGTLKAFLAETLTDYMVPAIYMRLENMPMTPNGKIDRKALPEPEIAGAEIVPPENDVQQKLYDCIAEAIGYKSFGITTDIYEAGLSSLGAIRLNVMLSRAFDVPVSLQDLRRNPTVQLLEAFIAGQSSAEKYEIREDYPLTQTQQGILVESLANPGTTIYNVPMLLQLDAGTDLPQMKRAIEAALDAHPYVKTILFADESGKVRTRRNDDAAPVVSLIECDQLPETETLVRPYQLLGDRLYRAELYSTPEGQYLFLDFHHIIYDGESSGILLRDIDAACEGKAVEKEVFTGFEAALSEEAARASDQYTKAKAWYDSVFAGCDANCLPMPDVRGGEKGSGFTEILTEADIAPVLSWCEEHRTTPNAFFNAVFGFVVSLSNYKEDAVFATIYNGRNDSRTDRSVGMFVKTLPVCCHPDGGTTVADYVKSVGDQILMSIENDLFSFAEISRAYDIKADLNLAWQGEQEDRLTLGGLTCRSVPVRLDTAKFPLSVDVMHRDGKISYFAEYRSDLFSEAFILRFLSAMTETAKAFITCEKLSSVSLLGGGRETEDVLALSKGETLEYNLRETWLDLFRKQVQASPEHKAVTDSEGSYTYAELDQASDAVAVWLIGQEVAENSFVALRMGRVKEFVAAAIGIHKAGAAYVPIDADYPEDRVNYMLEDSQAALLMTEETARQAVRECADAQPVLRAAPDTLAYMIYTSGSTGRPKGVMIPHRALTNFVHFIASRWGLTENSRIACHSNFAFDASVEDLYPVLTAGGELFIVPEEVRRDVDEMRRYLKENAINGGCYSTQFGQLLAAEEPLDVDYLCLGGEAMTSVPQARGPVYNTYGPTEFTVDATYFELRKGESYAPIPIGRPLHNCYAFVCDANGHLLPRGMAGELCLAGPQIAEGYRNRSDLTEKVFVDCAWLNGQKMYRTGDLARWNPEDQLEYLGRIDNQVKLRGFRIEMGEIENRAGQYEGIRTVAAQVRRDTLVLYYTADREIDPGALKAFLAETLTDYMVPAIYMRLENMPMTPNGKIDRKALPEPEIAAREYVEPAGAAEQAVAAAMQKILNMKTAPGALDSFFELGGDSIKAIRLSSLLRDLDLAVSVADIMRQKTVRGIAGAAQAKKGPEISQQPFEGDVEETPIVAFFRDLHLPQPWHYNQTELFLLRDRMTAEKLQRIFNALTVQHDMLRAVWEDSRLTVRPADAAILIEEHSAASEEEVTAICQEIQSHIRMEEALVRAALIHAPDADYFCLACHHLVIDGVSWRIITADLETAFAQDTGGKAIQLPRKTQPYADYARAIRKYADSYQLAQEIPYWNAVQKKLEALPLSDGKDYSREFVRLTVTMSAEDTERFLRTNFDAFGLTLNDALLTAVCRSWRQVKGDRPVSVQLEGHGREELDEPLYTDRTVGWFTSIYPVVFAGLTGDMRRDLMAVKETLHRIPHKGVGYNVLRYVGGEEAPDFLTDRLPPLCFNYLGEMDEGSPEEEKQFRPAHIDTGDDISPRNTEGPGFSINCLTRGGEFTLTADYDQAEFDPGQAERIAGEIPEELRRIAKYLTETHTPMTTASDRGETEWSEEEFEAVTADFESRGERVERIYPLLPMQESMLLKHLQEPEAWAYRLVDIFEMDWAPTQAQLRHVLDRLGSKHEVLRTSILHKNVSVPRQAIIDRPLGLAMADLTAEADPEAAVKRLREEILTHGYDLQDKPLFGLTCAKVSDSRCYLVQAQHHIITDGWCTALCMEDLTRYLQEEMTGKFTADERPVRGRYEAAVREILRKDMKAGLDYWHELLTGYETRAEIPSFGTVAESERSEEDLLTVVLDAEKTRRLEQLCGQEGATLSNAVELAWGMVLGVCSRTQDAVFAKVVSGRDNTETKVDDVVGLFINSVPVRVKWDDRTSVRDALRALNQQAARSNVYDYCPLADIAQQTELGSELLQSVLAFENFAGGKENGAEAPLLRPLELREEIFSAINPVSYVENGRLTFCITFDTRLYRGEEIRRLLSMVRMLLEGMIRNPERALTALDLLDEDGIREIIARSKGETLAYDIRETWLDLFRKWVKERPDHVAVVDSEGSYTYAELDAVSNALAAWLIGQGVKENNFVALRMGRVKEFAAAIVGVHKAGAAYVPVDPEYPEDRISFMLEDSEAKVTLDGETVRKIAAAGENAPGICLAKPENRAYMIYTSGSTGRPKGVVQPHSSLRTMLAWLANIVGENPVDAHHPSFSFDASINDLFPPLAAGGQVHILADELRKDPAAMDRYIREHGITGMTVSTQIGMALINQFPDMPIRFMMMGGEKMLPCEKTDIQLINGYGPTEFTVCSSYHIVNQEKDLNIPIGRPVPNTWSLICDDRGRLLPRGMAGELCLAGPQIAEGYWKRPDLTEKAFVDCPWLPGEKMYRTGDLARYNENDELEYLGRIDNQVKLRGFRIELGEIENRASQYEGIRAVTAQVRRDTLVLYYTAEGEINADGLKAFLAETLTEYMVPEIFMRLENMPMTPNGKINLKALPDPDISDRQAPYAPPRNPIERTLCEAFAEVLGLDAETFGIDDDFFALGGNSIRCMRAVSIANISKLSISDIYRLKTPARISEALGGMKEDDISEEQARGMSILATTGQLSMMDYQFTHAKSVMYNIPSLYRIDDRIGDDRLASAVNAVIRNHPALCTVFETDEEYNFVQCCRPDLLRDVQWEDIAPEDLHSTINGLVRPFTDYRTPLFRIRLLRCGRLRYLFMDMHHMISDGFSVGVLRENILRAVRGEPLPEDYYYTFLLREQKAARTSAYAEAKQYFSNLLGDTDWCNIPKPDFASWDSEGAEEMISLSLTLAQMEEAQARLKASGNVICLTAGALALREYSGREDVLLNWINDNRSRAGNESTVGLLFKILPVALHMDEYPDVKTLVEEIRRQTDTGFAHSICNYQETTEKALEDSIEINYLPGLANGEEGTEETGILEEVELADRHSAAGERVGMYIGDMDGVLAVSCSYQKRIYAPGSMRRFLELFRKHLQAIVLDS